VPGSKKTKVQNIDTNRILFKLSENLTEEKSKQRTPVMTLKFGPLIIAPSSGSTRIRA